MLLLDLSPARDAIDTIVKDPLVSVMQCDVIDFHALRELVSTHQVTEIVHTAARFSTAIRKDILAGVRVNVRGAMNVIEVARQLGVERVVLANSTIVGYPAFGGFQGAIFPRGFPFEIGCESTWLHLCSDESHSGAPWVSVPRSIRGQHGFASLRCSHQCVVWPRYFGARTRSFHAGGGRTDWRNCCYFRPFYGLAGWR